MTAFEGVTDHETHLTFVTIADTLQRISLKDSRDALARVLLNAERERFQRAAVDSR
jgi:hypothetical protein